ncbi:fructose-2,6-bisphosphatase TIGAR isoform X1 [Tachyglossus aculeatus]|uniref:fructose-2,6-bisphosphatase TIGAR isoform X1 n=1 Tax=Tachyglossus aculeatus TaxID=9261 RepID=UPI0018F43C19|nr:fructose-2,6-bisphosphatase TIGAR isoform X1 [Tachyglossus aculeatus]
MTRFGLTVVRHGETRYNKEKILQGQGVDEPLSETGFRQAAAAGMFLSQVKFTHVFSSDLTRTRQQTTATILEKSEVCKDVPVRCDSRIRERKYGVAEGKPLSQLRSLAQAAGEHCPAFTPTGGETLEQVKLRAKDFFEFLCQLVLADTRQKTEGPMGTAENGWAGAALPLGSSGEGGAPPLDAHILVVSHGAYMRSWLGYLVKDLHCALPPALSRSELSAVSPNTGISHFVVGLDGGTPGAKPTVQCLCVHLHDHLASVTDA